LELSNSSAYSKKHAAFSLIFTPEELVICSRIANPTKELAEFILSNSIVLSKQNLAFS
jgi:hypothetical protein